MLLSILCPARLVRLPMPVGANAVILNRHTKSGKIMYSNSNSTLLQGVKIVSLALNVPGPVAAAGLRKLGADVTKVEPPSGDATRTAAPAWYESLCQGQTVLRLDLKTSEGGAKLSELPAGGDL